MYLYSFKDPESRDNIYLSGDDFCIQKGDIIDYSAARKVKVLSIEHRVIMCEAKNDFKPAFSITLKVRRLLFNLF